MSIKLSQPKPPHPDIIDGIYYPSSDGKPLAETPLHLLIIRMVLDMLEARFPEPDVCIAGDMFVYYEEGNPRRHVAPDVMFVRGAPRHEVIDRRAYHTWLEPRQTLDWVLEVTSSSTHREDRVTKRRIYQDHLGVREYFLFDPYQDWLNPPLQGWRLHNGVYQRIEWVESRLPSEVLGLHLEHDGKLLRLYNPATQLWLSTAQEKLDATQDKLREEEQARKRAEEENQHLRDELERLKQQRADAK